MEGLDFIGFAKEIIEREKKRGTAARAKNEEEQGGESGVRFKGAGLA